MNRYCNFAAAALALTLVAGAASDEKEVPRPAENASAQRSPSSPPVLKGAEPKDSVLLILPGPRVKPAQPQPAVPNPPAPSNLENLKPADSGPPVAAAIKPGPARNETGPLQHALREAVYPPDFQKDSATFCQHRIGQWTQADAYNLLGDALRERAAYADDKTENGRIYAFADPTGRYRALELDFAADSGLLRTVFVYPWSMTWIECRRLWGGKVTATGTNNGRTFYSYLDHRMDVLVDPAGKVVSLGFY